jgi:biotin carboxylase
MTHYKRDIIVIVDAASTSQYYVPLFVGRGYRCIHVDAYYSHADLHGLFNDLFFKTIRMENAENLSGVIKELKNFSIKAIVAGCETGIETADAIADYFNVPKNNVNTVKNRSNKFYMNEALRSAGIPCAKQVKSANAKDLIEWFKKEKLDKAIFKPIRGALSEGVAMCKNSDDIQKIFDAQKNKKNMLARVNNEFVLQEYLDGREYIVNTVSYEGQHFVTDIWLDEFEDNNALSLDLYASLVNKHTKAYEVLSNYVKKVLDAVGLKNGPAHSEVKYTSQGPKLVEVNARLAGGLDWYAVEQALGYSQLSLAVDSVLNPELFSHRIKFYESLPQKQMRFVYFYSEEEGTVAHAPELNRIVNLPTLKSMVFYPTVGDVLHKTRDTFGHPGYASFVAEDIQAIERDYFAFREIEKQLFLEMVSAKPGY